MNCVLILVNQLKQKIGVMFGPSETYIGKNPIDFHSAITLEMTRGKTYPETAKDAEAEGIITKVNVSKNKVGKPFGRVEYITWFDRGIDTLWECISFLRKESTLLGTKSGYYQWEEKSYRQKQLYELANADPKISADIHRMAQEVVYEKLNHDKMDDSGAKVPAEAAAG